MGRDVCDDIIGKKRINLSNAMAPVVSVHNHPHQHEGLWPRDQIFTHL